MTKLEYIDFIRNSLQQIDDTSRFHREQVSAALNLAVNTVFYEMYKDNPMSLERYTTVVSSTPSNAVAPGSTLGRYVSTLTVDVVDLPKKAGGVIEILTGTTTTTKFVPVSTIEGEHLYGSESSLPGNVIGYSLSGARYIEFWDMSAAEAAAGVVLRVIQQFKSYSNTDNVKLPYGQDERIIELVRQYLGVIPPKDLINDNADIKI